MGWACVLREEGEVWVCVVGWGGGGCVKFGRDRDKLAYQRENKYRVGS